MDNKRGKLEFELVKVLAELIRYVMETEHEIPDGFRLEFGSDLLKIKADIDLKMEPTDRGRELYDALVKDEASCFILQPEDLK